jgi:hypothetical protein
MGEAFILRKGGGGKQALAPTVTQVNQTETSVIYNITNNDDLTAMIRYRINDIELTGDVIELATGATSNNFTLSSLDNALPLTVFANANVVGKVKSITTEKVLVPTQTPAPTITITEVTPFSVFFTLKNNSTEQRTVSYGLSTPPALDSVVLNSNQTSSVITISSIDFDTSYNLFAQAGNSTITSAAFTTDPEPIFTAATGGTTLEYNDSGKRYRSHTFTSNGTFTVTTAGDGDRNQTDYLIIAGGGGGSAGGGGAGGYRTTLGTSGRNSAARAKVAVTAQSYTITVGAGGGGQGIGGASSALGVTTVGGGHGGSKSTPTASGSVGGSGGGAGSANNSFTTGSAGTIDEGFNGGNTATSIGSGESLPDGGGGGASGGGQSGTLTPSAKGGNGGNGLANILRTGSTETRAGGGGGFSGGSGGSGGGGAGGSNGQNGVTNTGSGGGGRAFLAGRVSGNGGSGIVVIRYEIAPSV